MSDITSSPDPSKTSSPDPSKSTTHLRAVGIEPKYVRRTECPLKNVDTALAEPALLSAEKGRLAFLSLRTRFESSGINVLTRNPDGTLIISKDQQALIDSVGQGHEILILRDDLDRELQKVAQSLWAYERFTTQSYEEFAHAKKVCQATWKYLENELAAILATDGSGIIKGQPLLDASLYYQVIARGLLGNMGGPRLLELLMSPVPTVPQEAITVGFKPTCFGVAMDSLILSSGMRESLRARYERVAEIMVVELRKHFGEPIVLAHHSGGLMFAELLALEKLKDDPDFNPAHVRLQLVDIDGGVQAILQTKLEAMFPDPSRRPYLSFTQENPYVVFYSLLKEEVFESAAPTFDNLRDPNYPRLKATIFSSIGWFDYLLGAQTEADSRVLIEAPDRRRFYMKHFLMQSNPGALIIASNFGSHTPNVHVLDALCKWPLNLASAAQMAELGHVEMMTHRLDCSRIGGFSHAKADKIANFHDGAFCVTTESTGMNEFIIARSWGHTIPAVSMAKRYILDHAEAEANEDIVAYGKATSAFRFFAANDWSSVVQENLGEFSMSEMNQTVVRALQCVIGGQRTIISVVLPTAKAQIRDADLIKLITALLSTPTNGDDDRAQSSDKINIGTVTAIDSEELSRLTGITDGLLPPFGLRPAPGQAPFQSISMIDEDLLALRRVWTPLVAIDGEPPHRVVWSARDLLTLTEHATPRPMILWKNLSAD